MVAAAVAVPAAAAVAGAKPASAADAVEDEMLSESEVAATLRDILERDERDSTRAAAPLAQVRAAPFPLPCVRVPVWCRPCAHAQVHRPPTPSWWTLRLSRWTKWSPC